MFTIAIMEKVIINMMIDSREKNVHKYYECNDVDRINPILVLLAFTRTTVYVHIHTDSLVKPGHIEILENKRKQLILKNEHI